MSDSGGFARVREIFHEVCELEGEERTRRLDALCAGDEWLRTEVEELLGYEDDPREPSEMTPVTGRDPSGDTPMLLLGAEGDDGVRPSVPGYRILRVIGHGGMGIVYEAEQESPRRRVAIKQLATPFGGGRALQRFRLEAEVLGRLEHPGIARIYEARLDPEAGPPLLVMELVDGTNFLDHVRDRDLSLRDRIELIIALCEAVQHAHLKGVVHRDLKAANVLVTADGQPKVLDFGIARLADEASDAGPTRVGEVLGTVVSMSPEQASGDPDAIDARTDVYALGVLAFQALLDRSPLDLSGLSIVQVGERIRDTAPTAPRTIDASFPRDLETVLLAALAKRKEDRFETPAAFRADLRRFLRSEPIEARPPTLVHQLRLFARRRRGLVTAVAAVMIAIVGGLAFSIDRAVRADRAADRERRARIGAIAASEEAIAANEAAQRASYSAQIRAISAALDAGQGPEARRLLDACNPELRGFEWHHFRSRLDTSEIVMPGVIGVAFEGDGVVLARPEGLSYRQLDGVGEGWEVRFDQPILVHERAARASVHFVLLADGSLHAVDAEGGVVAWGTWPGERGLGRTRIAPAPDGESIVLFTRASNRRRQRPAWIMDRSGVVRQLELSRAVAWSPDGRRMATDSALMREADGSSLGRLTRSSENVQCLAFSPDGRFLAMGTSHPSIHVIDTREERQALYQRGAAGGVLSIDWSPNGKLVIEGNQLGSVLLRDAATGRIVRAMLGHEAPITKVAIRGDGRWLAATAKEGVRFWRTDEGRTPFSLPIHDSYVSSVACSPDGTVLASLGWDSCLRLVDAWTLEPLLLVSDGIDAPTAVAWSRDQSGLIASEWGLVSYPLSANPPASPREQGRVEPSVAARMVAWPGKLGANRGVSPGGRWLSVHRRIRAPKDLAFNDAAGEQVQLLDRPCRGSSFSVDGRWLAAASTDGRVHVFDGQTFEAVCVLDGHEGEAFDVAWSPGGDRLASAGGDGIVRLYDSATWSEVATLTGHEGDVRTVAFSSDGTRLFSGGGDGSIRIWSTLKRHDLVAASARMRSEGVGAEVRRLADERRADDPARWTAALGPETGVRIGTCVLEAVPVSGSTGLAIGLSGVAPIHRGEVRFLADPRSGRGKLAISGTREGDRFGASLLALRTGADSSQLLVGAPGEDVEGLRNAGVVHRVDPESGAREVFAVGSRADAQLGRILLRLGDCDGDGIADVAAIEELAPDSSARLLRVFSGRNGRGLLERAFEGRGDVPVFDAGDHDGDARADVGFFARRGRIEIVSGVSGEPLVSVESPFKNRRGRHEGHAIGDLDGDGRKEVVIAAASSQAGNHREVALLRGADLKPIWLTRLGRRDPARRVHVLPDCDGDGWPELAVRSGGNSTRPELLVVSGASGAVLQTMIGRDRFGQTIAVLDLHGDQRPELVAHERPGRLLAQTIEARPARR